LRFKKITPFLGKERRTVLPPVEFQKETSVGLQEPCPNIIDEKFPIDRRPLEPPAILGAPNAMETDAVASHQIKFRSKSRQRRLRLDPRNDAADTEMPGCAAKERFVVRVKAESLVTEEPSEIEKITRATAKIENLEWRRAIKPKVLNALNVYADPVGCVFVGVDSSCIGAVRIVLAQPL